MGAATVISVDGLTRRFGDFVAVDAVSFEVERGEIFGYLGANGAGKSTTIKMLCGLLPPSAGDAVVAGQALRKSARAIKRVIGYMSQKFSLYMDLTVEENLRFFAGAYALSGARGRARVEDALARAGLEDRRGALTGDLPGGIRQRLALASALLHEPAIVFLDEPTAGVDPASRRDFWRLIRALSAAGTTVFVTTHHLDEAEYCDRVGMMVDGKLVALDTPQALKRDHVKGRIHAVIGDVGSKEVGAALAGTPGLFQVQPFGRRVQVRAEGELGEPETLVARLREAGLEVSGAEPVAATLEDVFLALAAGAQRGD